ncbi:hypothetical protein Bca4012_038699 [Brassica carinata]|uniref:Uncharacterized protein n=1 Tax=Brassica carinata TaxID=52824 RepID=A0A8X7W6X3_BRACI|nr:hypothetical protein Bca52824_006927 [Brassica carinata]
MDTVERKRPRGAFLNLFDWPGKSRNKLFSSNISQISESKQSKENVHNPSITRHPAFEADQSVKNSTFNQGSNSSCCASSVTSDYGNVVKAPCGSEAHEFRVYTPTKPYCNVVNFFFN